MIVESSLESVGLVSILRASGLERLGTNLWEYSMADTVEYYQNLVAENPYDVQNWDGLISSVKSGPASDEQTTKLREIYENIVSIFPTAVSA